MDQDFTIYAELEAFEKAGDDHAMRIGGIVSTSALDADQERIVQEGLDFDPFLRTGWFNDNHGSKTHDVLGYPTAVKLVKKGEVLPNGRTAKQKGWWAEGYLLNTDEGRKVWGLTQALQGSTHRRLGFSIEGKVGKRDENNPKIVKTAVVRHVAITHCPKNPETELNALAKALTAGHGILSGDLGDSGGPLRQESLDGGRRSNHEEGLPPMVVVHLCDPDQTGGKGLHKAATGPIDGVQYVQEWAQAFARVDATDPAGKLPDLTKAEARIIVRSRLPAASESQIDDIIAAASGRRTP